MSDFPDIIDIEEGTYKDLERVNTERLAPTTEAFKTRVKEDEAIDGVKVVARELYIPSAHENAWDELTFQYNHGTRSARGEMYEYLLHHGWTRAAFNGAPEDHQGEFMSVGTQATFYATSGGQEVYGISKFIDREHAFRHLCLLDSVRQGKHTMIDEPLSLPPIVDGKEKVQEWQKHLGVHVLVSDSHDRAMFVRQYETILEETLHRIQAEHPQFHAEWRNILAPEIEYRS